MSRTAATLMFARQLAEQYRFMGQDIEKEALRVKDTMPLTRRILRQYALIARRAAYAEELDPETPPRNCRVCGGETVCV